ncbi:nucleoplasmin-2a isoform X2 [Lepisosteus oculatus]|uniref:Nucleoplasmin ATPase-like n=1 Tax=Lepisosteus oculatus TaxID=7918 RepID=W5NCQ9_LEPOC|nr:PREDICTED: nucleoplasmin ATPase-like isoform X2 [Lepisosteus oculatus]
MDPVDVSSISSLSKPVCVLWGCELNGTQRKFNFEVEDDLLENQLFIKTICLSEDASDDLHVIEVEARIMQDVRPIPIATLRASVQPMWI